MLTACKDCNQQVSLDAKHCIHCGAKVKKPMGIIAKTMLLLIVLSIIAAVIDKDKKPQEPKPKKSQEQIEADKRSEAAFQADVIKVKSLRESLKNPNSFELVSAGRIDKTNVLCIVYRATNSFNAVVTEQVAISTAFKVVDWNSNCAGKSGEDMKRIRHAL